MVDATLKKHGIERKIYDTRLRDYRLYDGAGFHIADAIVEHWRQHIVTRCARRAVTAIGRCWLPDITGIVTIRVKISYYRRHHYHQWHCCSGVGEAYAGCCH